MFAVGARSLGRSTAIALHPYRAWTVLIAFYLILMAITRPVPIGGDTVLYAADIQQTLGHKWTDSDAIWNFSHVLWRPLGRAVFEIFGGAVSSWFDLDTFTSIIFCLAAMNFVAALVCILGLYAILWRLTGREWVSVFLCASFALLNPLLNYSRYGTPHVVGLAFTILALYFAAFHPIPSRRNAIFAGVFSALAVCMWIQYIMSFPAILLAGFMLQRYGPLKGLYLRRGLITCVAFGLILAVAYGLGFIGAHIDSMAALSGWIREAAQERRERKALRLITGMTRGVYEMGYDALWFKWFIFKDPYANVTVADLIRTSLAKIALFYATLGALFLMLATSRFGRRILLLIGTAMVPHIFMALVYESGSVERYLPFLPFLWFGFAWVLSAPEFGRAVRILAAVLCCLHVPFNLESSWRADRALRDAVARLSPMTSLPAASRLWVIHYNDGIARLNLGFPFHPLNRDPRRPKTSILIQTGTQVPRWRAEFACLTLSTMDAHGEVWVTRRVLAERPRREWLWAEGDDPRVKWRDLYDLFQPFDHTRIAAGDDGFFQLPENRETRARLLSVVPGGNRANCPSFEAGSWRRQDRQ